MFECITKWLSSLTASNDKKPFPYVFFSDKEKADIDKKFENADGYITKLTHNNKIFGYLCRCSVDVSDKFKEYYKNDNLKKIITYVYQPKVKRLSNEQTKYLAKSHCLKKGTRICKRLIKEVEKISSKEYVDSYFSEILKMIIIPVEQLFPYWDKRSKEDKKYYVEFNNLTESEYNELMEYIYKFDKRVMNYYTDFNEENLLKIWIKF